MSGIPFLHKSLSKITFLTVYIFFSKSAENIINELNAVNSMDKARGSKIDISHVENKFNQNALRDHIMTESLNIYEKGLHIPIIKRSLQNTKQIARFTTHSMPYKSYTKIMTISLV